MNTGTTGTVFYLCAIFITNNSTLMKKLLFPLLAALAFTACQNDSATIGANNATSQDAAASQPAQSATLPAPAKVAGEVQSSINEIKSISDQIDALPDNIKRTKSEEINELRSMAESLTEKQTKLMEELNASAQPAPGSQTTEPGSSATSPTSPTSPASSSAGAVQEAVESIARYRKDVDNMKEQLKAISGKQ